MHLFFVRCGMKIVRFQIHPAEPIGEHPPDRALSRSCYAHHEKNHFSLPPVGATLARAICSSKYSAPPKSRITSAALVASVTKRDGASVSQTRSAIKKAGLLYFVFVMFAYTTGGPFGLEEMVTTSGPGHDADVPAGDSTVLEHPGFVGHGGTDNRDSRGRRILPVGARQPWRLLGLSDGLVELERVVAAGRELRGSVH